MPVIPDGFGQVNFIFTGYGMPTGAEVTLGFDQVTQPFFTPEETAEAFRVAWANSFLTLQSSYVTLAQVLVKFGPNDVGPSGSVSPNSPGLLGTSQATPNTAVLIRKQTNTGGRRGRGRMYVPGVIEGEIDANGVISGTHVTAWQVQANEFYDAVIAGGMLPVVLHAAGISATPAPTPITSLQVQGLAATQRRRLRR